MITMNERNAPQAFDQALIDIKIYGVEQNSRNGPVLTIQQPYGMTISNPRERVINSAERNANHFYHLMEMVWMMAGGRDVQWLAQFNKGVLNYCDAGTTHWHGAYGHRWRSCFDVDQIKVVTEMLKKDPSTRRAVITMWSPWMDLSLHADLPCNTHIYFRASDGALHMTVCNRSNDLIWGMLGANVVHMTYLQELVAHGAGLEMGKYQVLTNNLHVYTEREDAKKVFDCFDSEDIYTKVPPVSLLDETEPYLAFLHDCEELIGEGLDFRTRWMEEVGYPVYRCYLEKNSAERMNLANQIAAPDWRKACMDWLERKK